MVQTWQFLFSAISEFILGILTNAYIWFDNNVYMNFNGLVLFSILFVILLTFIRSLISKGGKESSNGG